MRTDGHDVSRFARRTAMPAIDHEANGPISALVRLATWLGSLRTAPVAKPRGPLALTSRH
jgi:hypothetical protein